MPCARIPPGTGAGRSTDFNSLVHRGRIPRFHACSRVGAAGRVLEATPAFMWTTLCHDRGMTTGFPPTGPVRRSRLRFAAMLVAGAAAAAATGLTGHWVAAPAAGWSVAALTYVVWVWLAIGRFDPAETRAHATTEDPSRSITDLLILAANVASLGAVAAVVVDSHGRRRRVRTRRRAAGAGVSGPVLAAGADAVHAAVRRAVLQHGREGRDGSGRHRLQPGGTAAVHRLRLPRLKPRA